ncbi:MAG: inositol monophosphatase [Actinobacteria bacterium]|nr:inositol monophosphatase [Actinomycetota bacterium]
MIFADDSHLPSMIRAAKEAGEILGEMFYQTIEVRKKGNIDIVTAADLESEKVILNQLNSDFAYPVYSEETFYNIKPEGLYFLVDPLDGTTNYSRKIPFYAVSIALMNDVHPVKGVVYIPEFGELYVAKKDFGAFLIDKNSNESKLSVSKVSKLSDALLATGFPYDVWVNYEPVLKSLKAMLTKARALRRFGSAAIDLCYVAKGIFDGFFELSLKPWDTAAGSLIVMEAGGMVSSLKEEIYTPFSSEILATNALIHEELKSELLKNLQD